MRPNLRKVINLFCPDENGHSKWVYTNDVINAGLSWTNNGNVRRGIAFRVHEYNWEFKRLSNRSNGTITELRLDGLNQSSALNQRIRKDIVDELKKQTVSNFAVNCIVPLVEGDKEIDHRWGRKECKKYEYINDVNTQRIEDFQLLSHSHNQYKRQQCKKCKETNLRYSPPNSMSFAIGSAQWDEEIGCDGCPLAEPELYR
jgi:hypothetical protein